MTLDELVYEVGGNVHMKNARVRSIERMSTGVNVWIEVLILKPSTVSVIRIDTWLAKLDEAGEVKCILQPDSFPILRNPTFAPRAAEMFPNQKEASSMRSSRRSKLATF